jgi:hypothetical protein
MIKTEIEIKNENLLSMFNDLEKILDKMARDSYIEIKILKTKLEIPTYINQEIIEKYQIELINEENNIIAKYEGGEKLIWSAHHIKRRNTLNIITYICLYIL